MYPCMIVVTTVLVKFLQLVRIVGRWFQPFHDADCRPHKHVLADVELLLGFIKHTCRRSRPISLCFCSVKESSSLLL